MSLPNFKLCFQVTAGVKRVTRGKRAPSFVPRALTASTALSSAMPARTAATVCTDTSASASTAGVERTAPSRLSAWLEVNTTFDFFLLSLTLKFNSADLEKSYLRISLTLAVLLLVIVVLMLVFVCRITSTERHNYELTQLETSQTSVTRIESQDDPIFDGMYRNMVRVESLHDLHQSNEKLI